MQIQVCGFQEAGIITISRKSVLVFLTLPGVMETLRSLLQNPPKTNWNMTRMKTPMAALFTTAPNQKQRMSLKLKMNKQNVSICIHPHDGTPLRQKHRYTSKPSSPMKESRHKLLAVDSVCEISRKGKTQDRMQIRCRLGLGTETDHKWVWLETFLRDASVLKWDCGDGYTTM